jgi:glucose uptake protein GlcU
MGDPEQPNDYAPEAGESPSEEEYCGRTSKEWWGLLTGSGSIVLIFIVIGISNLNECGSIQVLPTYIVICSLGLMSLAVIKFSFRTEKFKRENAQLPLDEQTFYATGALADLLAVSMVGVAIWGAVLTHKIVRLY